METCPICGEYSLRVSYEESEAWGRVERIRYEECLNSKCGEDE